jgi:spore coat protein U-like protein
MKNFARLAALAAAATITATPAAAQVAPSNGPATATLRVTKPLILTRNSHLDFGTVVVWGDGTVDMEQDGSISCTAATLTCDPTGSPASFSIQGTNNRVVQINAPASVPLSNGTDSLTLVTDFPATRTLNNSGVGNTTNFAIGGSVALLESTPGGTYTGTINVTVQYQ